MIRPIKKGIVVELAPVQDKTESGIIMQRAQRDQTATVVSVGSTVEVVEPGDKVLIEHGQFMKLEHPSLPSDKDYALVQEDKVAGIF